MSAVLAAHAWVLGPKAQPAIRVTLPAVKLKLMTAPAPSSPQTVMRKAQRPTLRATKTASAPLLAIAPPLEWVYALQLNGREGRARLHWQVQGGNYRLQLDRQVGDHALPGWRSTGELTPAGLAPTRYAELRGERDAKATNFRRDEGLISYSAGSEQSALPEGVQDHISWWLQLASVVARAAQKPMHPGQQIHLPVAGLRGEPANWVFELLDEPVGEERASNELAPRTLHLRRPGLSEWDGPLDVWLDPARNFLPVRLQSGDPATRGFSFVLLDSDPVR